MRSIVRFTLNPAQNGGNVFVQHIATIDQSKKTITLKLPSHLDLKEIRPEIVAAPSLPKAWRLSIFPLVSLNIRL